MSLNFGEKQTSGSQTQNTITNPWAPAIPALTGIIQQAQAHYQPNATPTQGIAFGKLESNAWNGDPNTGATRQLSTDLLNSGSWDPVATGAYDTLKSQLSPIANMNVDPTQSPGMANVLDTIRNDISNQVNQQFAGAGRDLSGMNQQTLARGIAQGEAEPLLNQYNANVAAKSAAANALAQGGLQTATTGQGLDQARAALRQAGVDVGQEALAAKNYGPNALLQIEQQKAALPFSNMGMLASLIYPAAGLGGTSFGHGNYDQSTTSFGGGLSYNMLSDERAKKDKEPIGTMLDGTPIYRYKYKDDPSGETKIGPMAQDIEKTTPEAVADVGPGGMKMVNLELATSKAAEIAKEKLAKFKAKGGRK